MAADQGTGTTFTFAVSGFQTGATFTEASGSMSRGAVETTHLGSTGGREFAPEDLPDFGELTVTLDWDPAEFNVTGGQLIAVAAETVTVTFPTGDTYAATMFCTGVNWGPVRVNERMYANCTFKVSGAVTIATP